jgi:hypothetical protein
MCIRTLLHHELMKSNAPTSRQQHTQRNRPTEFIWVTSTFDRHVIDIFAVSTVLVIQKKNNYSEAFERQ